VETADRQFPDSAQLWSAFSIDDSTLMSGLVSLRLEGKSPLFRNVHRAEVMRQVWKWSGRPVSPALPPCTGSIASGSGGTCSEGDLREWEVREFGSRYDFDHLVIPMKRLQANSFSYVERMQGPGSLND